MNLCILIPAYNEARTISQVVSRARSLFDHQAFLGEDSPNTPNPLGKLEQKSVVVVDDGSKDDTVKLAYNAGAVVLKHPVNKGKGAALRTGFQYVLEHNYDAVITMDSDGQHDVDDIPGFLKAIEKLKSGIVIGSRMGDISTMPAVRKCTNKLTSFANSLLAHQKVEDSQSGFRLITADVLRAVTLEADRYEMESELLIKASKAGFRITSVPIKTIYGQEKSKIRPVADTYRFFRLFFRSLRW